MFLDSQSVLYFSLHRYDGGEFYPGGPDGSHTTVGEDAGVGYTVNVPWPGGGAGDAEYLDAFHSVLLPIARRFDPDLVLVSAGFDAAGAPAGFPWWRCSRRRPHRWLQGVAGGLRAADRPVVGTGWRADGHGAGRWIQPGGHGALPRRLRGAHSGLQAAQPKPAGWRTPLHAGQGRRPVQNGPGRDGGGW
mmetsp:Transcript_55669/g.147006  ORF Transcript_55669/g.147006 Transcript_55669/m.147006 type:complete len:190 (+) Transcript_55669:1010-1579(+)